MSEQYAFAIGFDRELEESGEGLDEGWLTLLSEVSAAIVAAGLPPMDSERWDEFGQGRVFWGTNAECELVRQVLSEFDLYIEEDRNLDPGYYATVDHTYYVDTEGEIYVLPDWGATDRDSALPYKLATICSIPLDAYRLKAIDLEVDAQVQAILRESERSETTEVSSSESLFSEDSIFTDPVLEDPISADPVLEDPVPADLVLEDPILETPVSAHSILENSILEEPIPMLDSTPPSQPVPVVPADVHAELQELSAQQAAQIEELEHRLRSVLVQVDELRSAASTRIEPKDHERLKLQCNQQSQRIEALQTQLQTTVEQFAAVQQQLDQQSAHILEIEQALAAAQVQAREWESKAEQSVNLEVHEKVQQQALAQDTQIYEMQQFIQRIEQQLKDITAQAEQKVDASRYEALEQDATDKATLIQDLRRTLQQQERDLKEWQAVAEAKVDWAEHRALREELERLQFRKKRGLFSRLFNWLWN
jgi:hypothetical protein